MTDLAAIKERHVPYWAAKMTRTTPGASDPAMRGDDVRQWCRHCERAWPCDAAQLLALLAATPSVEPRIVVDPDDWDALIGNFENAAKAMRDYLAESKP